MAAGGFRWLHLALAHQGTIAWINRSPLPDTVRELLLSPDDHQRALIDGDTIGCVIHDFERDFDTSDASRIGALRVALTPTLMVTARLHPIQSADLIHQKLSRGGAVTGAAAALDILVGTVADGIAGIVRAMRIEVQQAEDAFLDDRNPPTTRGLIGIRRRLAQLHHMLDGMRAVFHRLEQDDELPGPLRPTVEKLFQHLQALDADALAVQAQLRLLREEIDIQQDQRTNQNLYLLSIMTALLLPATLVTGLFGMNTGGLPWATTPYGTAYATLLAFGTALASYALLRWMGFMRR